MNCWEFTRCGREKGGINEKYLGICPAYPAHGTHCAQVAGTLCSGKVQGTLALKLRNCVQECKFYNSFYYDKSVIRVGKNTYESKTFQ